jgi:hypothetical protein
MSARGCFFAAALALATFAGPAGAASKMYKCVEGGRTIYQQQACAVTPQESPASAPAPAAHASAASEPASAGAGKVKRSSPASSVPATPR